MTDQLPNEVIMLTLEQLNDLAKLVKEADFDMPQINWSTYTKPRTYRFEGTVVAKQRPRFTKGRAFTPTETRKCEAAIKKWAKDENIPSVTYPLRIKIEVLEAESKEDAVRILDSIRGLVYHNKGDVDNFGKTILDALNGIAYRDDKQIAHLEIKRRYARNPGFIIRIERCGLNKSEYANFRKMMAT